MNEENLPTRSDEGLDDPFDLDIRIYHISEEREDQDALNATGTDVSTGAACGARSPGCM